MPIVKLYRRFRGFCEEQSERSRWRQFCHAYRRVTGDRWSNLNDPEVRKRLSLDYEQFEALFLIVRRSLGLYYEWPRGRKDTRLSLARIVDNFEIAGTLSPPVPPATTKPLTENG
jgi:hypothetical protein